MSKFIFSLAAILVAGSAYAGDFARVGGGNAGCSSCGGGIADHGPRTWGPKAHKHERFTGWFHSSPKATVAPWYLYYPYNGMFQTPFPVGGNPYGGMVNPYFQPGQ